MNIRRRAGAVSLALAIFLGLTQMPEAAKLTEPITASAASLSINDMPSDYRSAADWIWENRVQKEGSVSRWNTIFDQIAANNGELNYVVRWQSYKQLTLEQRKQFAQMVDDGINEWCKWLVGYENWPYEHIKVNIVGWAVLDKSCLLDLQPDEVVWDNLHTPYDSSGDTSNGYETIPTTLPSAPEELWTFNYFTDRNHIYNGQSFDQYLWCTEGFPNIGGCGGDWGQRLSDNAFIGVADGTGFPHVYWHELGHGFGMTDFYGGEGEADGFPPGGFPGGENSLMMAGSASKITDFDGWFLRYLWTNIKDDSGRFDLSNPPVTTTTTTTTTVTTTTTTAATTIQQPVTEYKSFTDTISDIGDGYVTFRNNETYYFSGDFYGGDENKNIAHYEVGDEISLSFSCVSESNTIAYIDSLTLITNIRDDWITGDVNADNLFNITDIVNMQKYLLGIGYLNNRDAGDVNKDGRINIFDLSEMKRLILNPADPSAEN